MYYAHFGLNEAPFRITPNTDVFFAGGNRGAILDALIYAIAQGEGIIKVTGEVGTGKTMMCNMLQTRLPAHIETVYLAHPSVSPEEILRAIAFELQLNVPRDSGRMELMQALYAYLLQRHALGKQVVVFVEESQNMPVATLEEVRLLSNLETGKHKLLQIVLFGQPELDATLRQPNIRQLRERITHSFTLPPFATPEVGEYLMFRVRAVGYRGPDLFSPSVVKRIAQGSAGLTRRINLIADKALLAAFSENTHTVETRHVAAAIRDSEFARDGGPAGWDRRRWLFISLAVALLAAAAAGIYFGASGMRALKSSVDIPEAARVEPAPPAGMAVAHAPTEAGVPAPEAQAPQIETKVAASEPAPSPPAPPVAAPDVVPVQQTPQAPAVVAVEASAQAEAKPAAEQDDILDSRIRATRRWLETEALQTYSIQLLGSANPRQLREHLSTISKSIEITSIFVYRTLAKQKPFMTVLYGSFGTREAALVALDRLPVHLKAFKPYLRTVQGIREEMSRNKTL